MDTLRASLLALYDVVLDTLANTGTMKTSVKRKAILVVIRRGGCDGLPEERAWGTLQALCYEKCSCFRR